MKDHQIAALVNKLRDIAVEFGQTQQLREHISRAVAEAIAHDEPQGVPLRTPLDGRVVLDARYELPPITLTGAQLMEALEFVAPDLDEEQLDTEVRIALRNEGPDIDGEMRPAGHYVWLAEYPEEGSMELDGKGALAVQARERRTSTSSQAAPVVPSGWKLVPPGWVAIPLEPTEHEWTVAQGTLMDMGWSATDILAARIQTLIAITRSRLDKEIAASDAVQAPSDARIEDKFYEQVSPGLSEPAISDALEWYRLGARDFGADAVQAAPACVKCGTTSGDVCEQNGCGFLTDGNGEQAAPALYGIRNTDTGVVMTSGCRTLLQATKSAAARSDNYATFEAVALYTEAAPARTDVCNNCDGKGQVYSFDGRFVGFCFCPKGAAIRNAGRLEMHPYIPEIDDAAESLRALAASAPTADPVRIAGRAMANICFNLSQHEGQPLTAQWCASMKEAQKRWDEALSTTKEPK